MKAQGYSAKEEKFILDALGRGLLREFPNPERVGCPPSEVLNGIAFHRFPLAEAEKWLDHLGSCSPCYQDFSQFQKSYQLRRRRTLLAIAASILVCAAIGGWALVQWHHRTQTVQTATLDLRNWSVTRGIEPNPEVTPLEVSREASRLNILLPLGSGEGQYDVRIANGSRGAIITATGTAKLTNGVAELQLATNLSLVSAGTYALQIRRVGFEWNSYPLAVH